MQSVFLIAGIRLYSGKEEKHEQKSKINKAYFPCYDGGNRRSNFTDSSSRGNVSYGTFYVTCAVMLGPWYAFICALAIGIIRMAFMGIPPLALTGAIFGAFFSGMLYRLSKGKLICAFLGEVIGTGIIGAIVSYPVMTLFWGKTGLTWFFYVPSFIAGTLIGGSIAFIFLKQLQKAKLLSKFQTALGSNVYEGSDVVTNDAIGIACLGFIGYLATVVIVNNFVANPTGFVSIIKYIVFAVFIIAAVVFWFVKKPKKESKESYV